MIRIHCNAAGGHVHMRVFLRGTLGTYACIGELCVRVGEFRAFRESWPGAEFIDKEAA